MKPAAYDETTLRAWVTSYVAGALGVPDAEIDPTAELMTLGIDSLSLIGLASELAQTMGESLPAEIMWEHTSIDALAEFLAMRGDPKARPAAVGPDLTVNSRQGEMKNPMTGWAPLRAIQPKGDRTPLFFVLAAKPGRAYFHDLARQLGEIQPVYGLPLPPGELQTLEKAAATLLDGLRTVQRRGPYRIAGFGFAGAAAYEMARQLELDGEEVEFLAMLEPLSPDDLRIASAENHSEDRLEEPATFGAYVPRAYSGSLTLFLNEQSDGTDVGAEWQALASGGVSVVDIAGESGELTDATVIEELADVLRVQLDRSSMRFAGQSST